MIKQRKNSLEKNSAGTYGIGLPTLRKLKRPQVVLKFVEVASYLFPKIQCSVLYSRHLESFFLPRLQGSSIGKLVVFPLWENPKRTMMQKKLPLTLMGLALQTKHFSITTCSEFFHQRLGWNCRLATNRSYQNLSVWVSASESWLSEKSEDVLWILIHINFRTHTFQ